MSEGEWVTVRVGSPWELDLFCGMLDDEDIAWRRPDDVAGSIDALVDPTGAVGKRLQVRESNGSRTRELIASRRVGESETDDDEYEFDSEEEVELIARYVRVASWSVVGILVAPLLLVLYRRACREHGTQSAQHTLTVAAPWIGATLVLLIVLAFRYVPGWLPDRTSEHRPPPPPPVRQPILPG